MCGIAGVVDLKGKLSTDKLESLITAMCDVQTHRGPDASGVWLDQEAGVALGHRRLSIIDLSPEGRQPMSAEGCKSWVTFNGEIYNFNELRDRMLARGQKFHSRSDTEILPVLFDNLEPGPLARLNGMFAFGVYNPQLRQILLARDAFGEKPLYIYEDENYFAFSSEMQSFYCLPGFKAQIDRDAVAEYLLLGYLPGPKTIYRHVRQLGAGSFERVAVLKKSAKVVDRGRFFHFAAHENPALREIDRRAFKERLRDLAIKSVEQKMISDVPLGAFLSGGVDSALVVSLVRKELGRDIDTFSIGFEGSAESEHEQAREIADHLGSKHHDQMLAPSGLDMIRRIAGVLDQPNGDSSCLPTYLLCEFARKHVTVCLSGDGGDELFGGYGRYRDTMNEWGNPERIRSAHGIDPALARPSDLYMSLRWHIWMPEHVKGFLGGMPDYATERVESWRAVLNADHSPVMHRMRTIDAQLYMPGAVLAKVDRMSMQHSLEVRCPLLDRDFAEAAMGVWEDDCWIAPDVTKSILKEIALEYLPREWLYRPKKGFGLPSNAWSMDNMVELCRDVLKADNTAVSAVVDSAYLHQMVDFQSQPGQFSIYQMWPLVMLELWLQAQPEKIAANAKAVKQAA